MSVADSQQPRLAGHQLLAHLLAGIAYGTMILGFLWLILLGLTERNVDEDGIASYYVHMLGTWWNYEVVFNSLVGSA